jgi:hypothetical protein
MMRTLGFVGVLVVPMLAFVPHASADDCQGPGGTLYVGSCYDGCETAWGVWASGTHVAGREGHACSDGTWDCYGAAGAYVVYYDNSPARVGVC